MLQQKTSEMKINFVYSGGETGIAKDKSLNKIDPRRLAKEKLLNFIIKM